MVRPLIAALCCASFNATAGAADAKRTPAGNESSISSAKKELEAVRIEQGSAMPSQAALPRVGLPEWHGPATPPTPSKRPLISENQKQSKNWLVDGVQRSKNDARDRENADEKRGNEPAVLGERTLTENRLEEGHPRGEGANRARSPRERPARAETQRDPATPAPDPFAPFLADWMSPQDFALLRGGRVGLGPVASEVPGVATAVHGTAANGSNRNVSTAVPSARDPLLASPAPVSSAPRENPYLQSLVAPDAPVHRTPAPAAASTVPQMSAPSPNALGPAPASPRSEGSAPTRTPEFPKAPADEKYFKQLKRF